MSDHKVRITKASVAPHDTVVVAKSDKNAEVRDRAVAVVMGGLTGAATTGFSSAAICLEGGTAHSSKRGVAAVLGTGRRRNRNSAEVGDGGVAMTYYGGKSVCEHNSVAVSIQAGSVEVLGKESVGVVGRPDASSTGTLGMCSERSLLVIGYEEHGAWHWAVGSTGDYVRLRNNLQPGTVYKVDATGSFVPV